MAVSSNDPRPVLRQELARVFKNQRVIRAFEKIFDLIPPEFISQQSQLDTISLIAEFAASQSNVAVDTLSQLTDTIDHLAIAPSTQQISDLVNLSSYPALDTTITVSWTGQHTFGVGPIIGPFNNNHLELQTSASTFGWRIDTTSSGAIPLRIYKKAAGVYTQLIDISNDFNHVHLLIDNQELRIGAGASGDLRLYHDGTDSFVRNDTGILKLTIGSTSIFEVTSARGTFNVPARLKGYTVATLPAGSVGDCAYVTDALAPAFLAVVAGGGAVVCKVFHNGVNWTVQ